jgi:hypothetical protein
MEHPLAMSELLASVPIILALCRLLGPARATPYAILGAYLLMPSFGVDDNPTIWFTINKLTVPGAALLAGVLLFDRGALLRFRPRWVDLPMLACIVAPLLSLAARPSIDIRGAVDNVWMALTIFGVPYLLGRLYFADREAGGGLAIAIVVAGLLTIPVCFYEIFMGVEWYIKESIFGIQTHRGYMVRLGGLRPEGCLDAMEMPMWMGSTTVLAFWLWVVRDGWRPGRFLSWLPTSALLATTIACRGAFGYVVTLIGLGSAVVTRFLRTWVVLAILLLIPPLYMTSRVAGLWDGQALVKLAGAVDQRSASSVGARIDQETQYIGVVSREWPTLVFGLGWQQSDFIDGWWVLLLKSGGLLAVATHFAAFLLPPALIVFRRRSRAGPPSIELGLALFVILSMIDSLLNTSLMAPTPLICGSLAGLFLGESGRSKGGSASRPRASSAEPGHATYRLNDIVASTATAREVDVVGPVGFAMATACLFYVFGHGIVEGQEGAKFVGGLGSALLFASVGALVAGSPRRSLARVTAFGLAFTALGITFNLALHPANRPFWSADILQGMALSGVVVACWRRLTGGGPWAYAGLAALASTWWAFQAYARPFPGSQYLFATDGLSLFPVLPWLTLAALGAVLVEASTTARAALALGLALATVLGWGKALPFGPPVKFPLNATYAMVGGSLASAVFWLSGPARRWAPIRVASDWLGSRWLVFFYIHLGIATGLARAGLTQPIACWAALFLLSIAATWLVSEATARVRSPFRHPSTWAVIFASTVAVGLLPGVPGSAVLAVAGGLGLLFAARYDDLATLTLGPVLADERPEVEVEAEGLRYLATLALVVAILVAPELVARLPAPFGTGPRPTISSPSKPTLPTP